MQNARTADCFIVLKNGFLDYFLSFVHPMNIVQAMAGVYPAFLLYRFVQEVDQEKEVTRDYRDRALQQKNASSSEVMSQDEWNRNTAEVVETTFVEDYKGEWDGEYLTLENGNIVRSYTTRSGVKQYEYVDRIPLRNRLKSSNGEETIEWRDGFEPIKPKESKADEILQENVNKQGEAYKGVFDFWIGDDLNAIMDEDTNIFQRAFSAASVLPPTRLIKNYDRFFMKKGNVEGKKDKGGNKKSREVEVVDDLLKNKTLTRQTGKVDNYESFIKGYNAALEDFNNLQLENIKSYPNGTTVGSFPDGKVVNVRPSSTNGNPTIEFFDPSTKKSIKIRY
ncbi:hypothetical protein [Oceanobacillus timonensis]|uniref:hypothetical protein n=1 Tax=Oceanobacillus timonensis TaxID=1926285 RepID=UPI001C4E181B|nr:hypothetical protein [Oceanobacillus timonensis]